MARRASKKPSAGGRSRTAEITESARLIVAEVSERIRAVRTRQEAEGNFDCYGRADAGFCDQAGCMFRDECIEVSRPALATVPVQRKK